MTIFKGGFKDSINQSFKGSFVALVTPMNVDGSLDWENMDNLVEWHLEQGTHGIVAVGTTGESATLTVREHLQVIQRVVDQVKGRVPVIAGTGANSTQEAIELTLAAQEAGVDACLLVTPYYNKPTQEGLFLHFEAIAKNVAIPQILYNVPSRTAVDMADETTIKLSYIDNIVAIKDATAQLDRVTRVREQAQAGFGLLSGDDATTREFILAGGDGVISVTANVAPKAMAQMCNYLTDQQTEAALTIDKQLQALHQTLFLESNPIPVKWAVAQLGLMGGGIRLPLTPLSEHHHQTLRRAMVSAGVLS